MDRKYDSGKITALVFLVLTLCAAFILKIVPALYSIFLSFKDYSPIMGTWNSPWVGLRNYSMLFSSPHFTSLLLNSAFLSLSATAIALGLGILLSFCVCAMSRGTARRISTALLLLPAFLPEVIVTIAAIALNNKSGGLLLVQNSTAPLIIIIFSVIRKASLTAFVCTVLGNISCDRGHGALRGILTGAAIFTAYGVTTMFSPSFGISNVLTNPMTYETTQTFEMYSYRTGLMSMQYSASAAMFTVKLVMQLALAVLSAFLLSKVIKLPIRKVDTHENSSKTALGAAAAAITTIVAAAVVFFSFSHAMPDGGQISAAMLLSNTVLMVACGICAAAILTLLSFGLSRYFGALTIFFVLGLAAIGFNLSGEYIVYRTMGLVNTYTPVILSNLFNPIYLLSLSTIAFTALGGGGSFSDFLHKISGELVMFCGVIISSLWCETIYSTIYINDSARFGLGTVLLNTIHGGASPAFVMILAILVPVILAALCMLIYVRTDGKYCDKCA